MGSVDVLEGAVSCGPPLAPIGIPVYDPTGRKVGHVVAVATDGVWSRGG